MNADCHLLLPTSCASQPKRMDYGEPDCLAQALPRHVSKSNIVTQQAHGFGPEPRHAYLKCMGATTQLIPRACRTMLTTAIDCQFPDRIRGCGAALRCVCVCFAVLLPRICRHLLLPPNNIARTHGRQSRMSITNCRACAHTYQRLSQHVPTHCTNNQPRLTIIGCPACIAG
jgi:hypothetical protein